MNKTLLVAYREFRQHIRSRGFLIPTILLPLMLIAFGLFADFSSTRTSSQEVTSAPIPEQPIGYVDHAGLIEMTPENIPADRLRRFVDTEAAVAALMEGEIGAYYVIPANYRQSGQIERVGTTLPTAPPTTGWFEEVLLANILEEVDAERRTQLRQPFNAAQLQVIRTDSEVDVRPAPGQANWLPMLVIVVILLPLFTSGGYLFQSLVQEKSSRVMEILLLSLHPRQLLSGKLLGLGALALVQYVIWAVIGLAALYLSGSAWGQMLPALDLGGREILYIVLYALGAYLLYAGLMAGIGAVTPTIDSNRIWIFVITLPMLLPIYLWSALAAAPNSQLAVVLSLLPFSAPTAMLLRLTVTAVPPWQTGVSLLLLLLTGVGIVLLMARLFHAQTLLSGETPSPGRMWRTVMGTGD
jgi:ABC-2 type transport system permease protein